MERQLRMKRARALAQFDGLPMVRGNFERLLGDSAAFCGELREFLRGWYDLDVAKILAAIRRDIQRP